MAGPPTGDDYTSHKALKQLLNQMIYTGRKQGYRIDDEAESLAGYCLVLALKHHNERNNAQLSSYATLLFLRGLRRLRRWRLLGDEDELVYVRKMSTDVGQRILMELEEPARSIAFGRWVERIDVVRLSFIHNMPAYTVRSIIASVRLYFFRRYEDEC